MTARALRIADAPAVAEATSGVLSLLSVPVLIAQGDGDEVRWHYANPAFEALGAAQARDCRATLARRVAQFLAGTESAAGFVCRVGQSIEARQYRVALARLAGTSDDPDQCLITLVDETGAMRDRETLSREMATDSLTGLPNRAAFADRLEELSRDGEVAVLMLDLERFGRVNTCLGSLAGDELLITVARRIRGALRGRDVLARTGGDEFGILLRIDAARGEAATAAARLTAAFDDPFRLSDFEVRIACAVGIAFGGDGTADPEDVIRRAQFAMKRAKDTKVAEAYHPAAFDEAHVRFATETALRRAIDDGGMRLFYQPICDLATGRIVAFETLARALRDDGTMLSPEEFIPVAEESGLILPLGRWALDTALATLAAWQEAGLDPDVSLTVNVSAIQFQRDPMVELVAAALVRHGVAGRRLKLELTESALVSEPERILAALDGLRALGVSVAMDDFGTGYSNLAYLQRLPIDLLKIDRGFVTGMIGNRDKLAIVRAILSLAQAFGIATVAEGIESRDLAQTLAAMGCAYGQGYFFARPTDAEGALALLSARSA